MGDQTKKLMFTSTVTAQVSAQITGVMDVTEDGRVVGISITTSQRPVFQNNVIGPRVLEDKYQEEVNRLAVITALQETILELEKLLDPDTQVKKELVHKPPSASTGDLN